MTAREAVKERDPNVCFFFNNFKENEMGGLPFGRTWVVHWVSQVRIYTMNSYDIFLSSSTIIYMERKQTLIQ